MDETVRVLVNPTAGRGRAQLWIDQIEAAVRAVHPCVVVRTESAAHARDLAASAAAGGAPRVIVAGGDGMVHAALQGLAGTGTELGIVPVGTANDIAAALGLKTGDLHRWAQIAARAPATPLDAGRTPHGWFLSVLTFGVSGMIIERAKNLRVPLGSLQYTAALLLSLPQWRTVPLRLEIDGVRRDEGVMLAALGNSAMFGGGMKICPTADPADGRGDLVLVGDVPTTTVLRVLPRVFTGGHLTHPVVRNETGRSFRFDLPDGHTGPPVNVYGDGELLGPLPVAAEIVPDAVSVAGAVPGAPRPLEGT